MTDKIRKSDHGEDQKNARNISEDMIDLTILWGRETHDKGAVFYFVGNKEIERAKVEGIDLKHCQGVHVVMWRGEVSTVYRNNKPNFRRKQHRHRGIKRQRKPQSGLKKGWKHRKTPFR